MSDPTASLIKAIQAKLVGDPDVAEIVGNQVFTSWGAAGTFPLIRLSFPSTKPWEDDCGRGDELQVAAHCYVQGDLEDRCALVRAVRDALDDAELDLPDCNLFEITYSDTLNRPPETDDASILTAIVRFRAVATATA